MNLRSNLAAWCIATLVASFSLAAEKDEQGFVSMFNGKDLSGWEGKPGEWAVEDGAITGRSTPEKPCPAAHYLMWRSGKPGDFVMRFSYRLVGGNSGVQFRSRELPGWDTFGYQADMEAGPQWSGCLFEHARGGVAMRGESVVIDENGQKHVSRLGDPAELQKHIKADDWNEYEIIAKGSEVTLKINGQVMAKAIDNDKTHAARRGTIALQMHPGPPMTVQFKDLRIKTLD